MLVHYKQHLYIFLAVLPPIEEVDLVVALCAVSSQSNQTFELMKDTIKSIVDKYGTTKIHYNVVIYGTLAIPTLDFSDKTLTKEDVKNYIDLLPKPRGKLYYDDDDGDDDGDNDDKMIMMTMMMIMTIMMMMVMMMMMLTFRGIQRGMFRKTLGMTLYCFSRSFLVALKETM